MEKDMKASKTVRIICLILAVIMVASLCYALFAELLPDLHNHAH